jgi:hypothetical protein
MAKLYLMQKCMWFVVLQDFILILQSTRSPTVACKAAALAKCPSPIPLDRYMLSDKNFAFEMKLGFVMYIFASCFSHAPHLAPVAPCFNNECFI